MDRVKLSQVVTGKLPYQNISKDDAIVIIGSAEMGPSMIPIEAVSIDEVVNIFGTDSSLTMAYAEFVQFGSGNVYLIRINGKPAESVITCDGIPKLTLVSIDCSDDSNNIYYRIETYQGVKYLDIIDKDDNTRTYTLNNKTFEELADEINRDAYISLSPVYAISHSDEELATCLEDRFDIFLEGGDSELIYSPEYAYDKIEECLNILTSVKISQLALLEGDILQETIGRGYLYSLLSQFAYDKVQLSQPCIITIGCSVNYPQDLLLQDLIYFADSMANITNNEYSPCEYINIVVAKLGINNMPSEYISDGVMTYCAMISNASLEKSITNEVAPSIRENLLRFNIEGKTHDEVIKYISDLGYVTFINDAYGDVRIYKSVNMLYGTQGKYYKGYAEYMKPRALCYLINVLLIQKLTFDLCSKLEPFLGEHIDKSKISKAVDDAFQVYKNVVKDYRISINEANDYRRIDYGNGYYHYVPGYTKSYEISFDIVPYGETESLSFALSLW